MTWTTFFTEYFHHGVLKCSRINDSCKIVYQKIILLCFWQVLRTLRLFLAIFKNFKRILLLRKISKIFLRTLRTLRTLRSLRNWEPCILFRCEAANIGSHRSHSSPGPGGSWRCTRSRPRSRAWPGQVGGSALLVSGSSQT